MADEVTPFERTGDRKVSFRLRPSGGKFLTVVANTHGLPAGISCPCRTSVCAGESATLPTSELERIAFDAETRAGGRGRETTWRHLLPLHGIDPKFPCYVVSDLRRGTEENAAYRNWTMIRDHLDDADVLERHVRATLDEFLTESKDRDVPPVYRFHWDGDIPTIAMAQAISAALTARPTVHAWLYTRSLFAVPYLDTAANLVTYISVDHDNADAAAPLLAAHPRVRAAALGHDPADAAAVLARLERPAAPVCPVDTGKLPVVTATSAARPPSLNEPAVGACALCQLCVHGRSDVRFTLRKVLHTPKKVSAATLLSDDDGRAHHFAKRPHVAALFDDLHVRLTELPGTLNRVWRRTYVTVLLDDQPLLRAQPRGSRLLLVYPTRPPRTRTHARLRDISGQRHQCPGVLELTVSAPGHLPEAARLAARVAAGRA